MHMKMTAYPQSVHRQLPFLCTFTHDRRTDPVGKRRMKNLLVDQIGKQSGKLMAIGRVGFGWSGLYSSVLCPVRLKDMMVNLRRRWG